MIVYKELASIEQDLGFPARTLYGLSNHLEKHYHNVFIPKSDGSKRKLSVPDRILKRVQRSIADNILAQYPISRYAKAAFLTQSDRGIEIPLSKNFENENNSY